MPIRAPGSSYPFQITVKDWADAPVDPDVLTFQLEDPDHNVVVSTDLTGLTRYALGVYIYDWTVPGDAALGTYTAEWNGELDGVPLGEAYETIDVVSPGSLSVPGTPTGSKSYLTRKRFASMFTGASIDGLSNAQVTSVLREASAIVDAFCNVPTTGPHSFLGGTARDEEHRWKYPQSFDDPGQRRIYPLHWPIRSITDFQIIVGHGAAAPIPIDSLVIDQHHRWVEITSLAIANASGLFSVEGWIIPIGGLSQPLAIISYDYGWVLEEVDDPCEAVDDTNKVFDGTHGYWISGSAAVSVDGDVVDPSDYTLDLDTGRITFADAQTGDVTASYQHRLVYDIAAATSLIAANLLGEGRLRMKGMTGIASLRVNEIAIERPRQLRILASNLETTVPDAADLLYGWRYWRVATA